MEPSTRYDLVTVLHVSADIVFVAGLLAAALVMTALSFQSSADLAKARQLIAGVRRWHGSVTVTALLLAWCCGIWLALQAGWFSSGWLHAKLVLVLALTALHPILAMALRRASAQSPAVPSRTWAAIPVLTLVAVGVIAWLAVLKPF